MIIVPSIIKFFIFSSIIVDLSLLVFIYFKEQKSLSYKFLSINLFGTLGWAITVFISLYFINVFVVDLIFVFALILIIAKYWFALVFPENKFPKSRIHYFLLIPVFALFIVAFVKNALFTNLKIIDGYYIYVENGKYSGIYSACISYFIFYPIFILYQKYKKGDYNLRMRNQIKYIAFGMSAFLVINLLTNSILPVFFHIYYFNGLGPVFSLILAAFIIYITLEKYFLEKIKKEQKQMMAGISHALQTPLAVMKGELEIWKGLPHESFNKQKSRRMKFFENSIDDVSRLIYDLLKLAKLEIINDNLKKEKINLGVLVEDVLEFFEVAAANKGIKIKKLIESDIYIEGDQEKLKELIINLLSNAVKYTAQSSGRKEISIILHRADRNIGKNIELIIEDTGVGIGAEDFPHIFEPFFGRNIGLGLAICRKIVEQHNGFIKAESQLSKGTKFTIMFNNVI